MYLKMAKRVTSKMDPVGSTGCAEVRHYDFAGFLLKPFQGVFAQMGGRKVPGERENSIPEHGCP